MSAVAFLAVIGMAQAATPAPSPLFSAFKAACYNVGQFDGIAPAATSAGWTHVTQAQADPRIAAISDKARKAVLTEVPDSQYEEAIFQQQLEGREVYLIASRFVSKQGYWGNGCRAYDLDMQTAPTRQVIDGWVGSTPSGVQANGTAVKRLWQPWHPGVTLEITYVPRNHAQGTAYGIQGLVLVSQSIGGF